MKSYGIETVNIVMINNIIEISITLPQDHQFLKVLGMGSEQIVKVWIELMDIIRNVCGICSILMQPYYELANKDGMKAHEELLNAMVIGDSNSIILNELMTKLA